MSANSNATNTLALMRAVYATKPPTVLPVMLNMGPVETVTFTVQLTQELIQAWGLESTKASQIMRDPFPQPTIEG